MAVSIFDENTPHDLLEFTPFDESKAGQINRAATETLIASGGIDTREVDAYRQGVEISTQTYRFQGLGAKIWSGNTEGYTTIRTFGQALPFTDFKKDKKFDDLLRKFDPVAFIELGQLYPFPIVFNDGGQQNKETRLLPFTIKFLEGLDSNEGNQVAHDVRASLEDGNPDVGSLSENSETVSQFISFYSEHLSPSPFLDEGAEYYGKLTGSLFEVTGGNSTIGLFKLNGDSRDHSGNNFNLGTNLPVTFSNAGPSPCTKAFHTSQSYGPILSSSSGTALALTGAMTMEILYYPSSSMQSSAVIRYLAGHGGHGELERNNILYMYYLQHSTRNLTYFHEYAAGSNVLLTATSTPISFDKWNHIAMTRTDAGSGNMTVRMYVNGRLVRTTTVLSSSGGTSGSFVIGASASGSMSTTIPDARFSSIRVLDYPLTTKEIQQSVSRSLLYPRPPHNLESIVVDGFLDESVKTIHPYDDRGNKVLIEQFPSASVDLLEVLTHVSSNINLDEDLRENYNQKSAPAGYSYYGGNSGQLGTDSIAFGGLIKGS